MTTKLDNESTFFLPFNMGNGEGINAGAGNPIYEDKYQSLPEETIREMIKLNGGNITVKACMASLWKNNK